MKNGFTELRVGARTAPLGLRFWDPVTAAFVGDGLRVSAYPMADPTRRAAASVSPSRVWVFHKLPGMGAVERGEGDEAFWASPPPKRTIVVEVDDDLGRFVPFQLEVEVPVRRPLEWTPPAGVSFPGMPPGAVPLFSSATRAVPRGLCVVRADLWDPNATTPPKNTKNTKNTKGLGGPGAWALVTAAIDGLLGISGLADGEGRVLLIGPYPAPTGGGEDGLTGVPLLKQSWPVSLSVRYEPGVSNAGERAKLSGAFSQAAGSLWQKWDADPAAREKLATTTLTLNYGEELPVRTTGAAPGGVLFVTRP